MNALLDLLDKYNIGDKHIKYEPISISQRRRRTDSGNYETYYRTSQQVTLTLSDFTAFEKIQIGLIQHSYDSFSAQFTSSKLKKAKDNALKAAIKKAQHKAHLIAKTSGVTLGPITHIQYSEVNVFYPRASRKMKFAASLSSDRASLLKYNRMLTVSATITIHYALCE